MSDLVGWFAFGVSAVSAAAAWTSVLMSRRVGTKDKIAKIEMADYVRRMTEAIERSIDPSTRNPALAPRSENGETAENSDKRWIIENVSPISWRLHNLAGDVHDVEIDRSNLNVESITLDGDLSLVHHMGYVDIKIQTKWKVPLPDELLVKWREHPDVLGVKLPKWRLG